MERKSTGELQEHMLWTYYGLRVGLSVIAIALPLVVLFAGGILHHVWLEPWMSQYYHTKGRLSFSPLETSSSAGSSPPAPAFTCTRASAPRRTWH